MEKKQLLERVTVAFRCPMSWEKMVGDERERFCGQCQKSVTDLSQMTAQEVESYVAEHGPRGSACVRIWRDSNGNLITKGCGSPVAQGQRVAQKAVTVGIAAGSLAAAACSSQPKESEVVREGAVPFSLSDVPCDTSEAVTGGVVVAGMICLPEESE